MRARFSRLITMVAWFLCGLSVLGAFLGPPQLMGPLLIAAAVVIAIMYERGINKTAEQMLPNRRWRPRHK